LKAGGGRRETPGKVLRIGVHHANGVLWEPVYRTTLSSGVRCLRHHVAPAPASFPSPPPPPPAPPPLVLRFRGFDAEGAGSPRSARLISAKSSSISSRVSVSWNVGWLAPARRGGLSDVSCGAQKYDGRCFGAVGSPRSHFVSSWRRTRGWCVSPRGRRRWPGGTSRGACGVGGTGCAEGAESPAREEESLSSSETSQTLKGRNCDLKPPRWKGRRPFLIGERLWLYTFYFPSPGQIITSA